jgi:plastocyanin
VTIALANSSPVEHNVTIAEGTKVLGATPTFTGGSKAVTLKLKPGKYTFYCSVPGHRQAGMEGTLTVS